MQQHTPTERVDSGFVQVARREPHLDISLSERELLSNTLRGLHPNPKIATPKSVGQWPASVARMPSRNSSTFQLRDKAAMPPTIRCPEGMPELKNFPQMLCCRAILKRTRKEKLQKRTVVLYKEMRDINLYVLKGSSMHRYVNIALIEKAYRQETEEKGVPRDLFVMNTHSEPSILIEQPPSHKNANNDVDEIHRVLNQCREYLGLPPVEVVHVPKSEGLAGLRQKGSFEKGANYQTPDKKLWRKRFDDVEGRVVPRRQSGSFASLDLTQLDILACPEDCRGQLEPLFKSPDVRLYYVNKVHKIGSRLTRSHTRILLVTHEALWQLVPVPDAKNSVKSITDNVTRCVPLTQIQELRIKKNEIGVVVPSQYDLHFEIAETASRHEFVRIVKVLTSASTTTVASGLRSGLRTSKKDAQSDWHHPVVIPPLCLKEVRTEVTSPDERFHSSFDDAFNATTLGAGGAVGMHRRFSMRGKVAPSNLATAGMPAASTPSASPQSYAPSELAGRDLPDPRGSRGNGSLGPGSPTQLSQPASCSRVGSALLQNSSFQGEGARSQVGGSGFPQHRGSPLAVPAGGKGPSGKQQLQQSQGQGQGQPAVATPAALQLGTPSVGGGGGGGGTPAAGGGGGDDRAPSFPWVMSLSAPSGAGICMSIGTVSSPGTDMSSSAPSSQASASSSSSSRSMEDQFQIDSSDESSSEYMSVELPPSKGAKLKAPQPSQPRPEAGQPQIDAIAVRSLSGSTSMALSGRAEEVASTAAVSEKQQQVSRQPSPAPSAAPHTRQQTEPAGGGPGTPAASGVATPGGVGARSSNMQLSHMSLPPAESPSPPRGGAVFPSSTGSPVVYLPPTTNFHVTAEEARKCITQFYSIRNRLYARRLQQVDKLLKAHRGREAVLLRNLQIKYPDYDFLINLADTPERGGFGTSGGNPSPPRAASAGTFPPPSNPSNLSVAAAAENCLASPMTPLRGIGEDHPSAGSAGAVESDVALRQEVDALRSVFSQVMDKLKAMNDDGALPAATPPLQAAVGGAPPPAAMAVPPPSAVPSQLSPTASMSRKVSSTSTQPARGGGSAGTSGEPPQMVEAKGDSSSSSNNNNNKVGRSSSGGSHPGDDGQASEVSSVEKGGGGGGGGGGEEEEDGGPTSPGVGDKASQEGEMKERQDQVIVELKFEMSRLQGQINALTKDNNEWAVKAKQLEEAVAKEKVINKEAGQKQAVPALPSPVQEDAVVAQSAPAPGSRPGSTKFAAIATQRGRHGSLDVPAISISSPLIPVLDPHAVEAGGGVGHALGPTSSDPSAAARMGRLQMSPHAMVSEGVTRQQSADLEYAAAAMRVATPKSSMYPAARTTTESPPTLPMRPEAFTPPSGPLRNSPKVHPLHARVVPVDPRRIDNLRKALLDLMPQNASDDSFYSCSTQDVASSGGDLSKHVSAQMPGTPHPHRQHAAAAAAPPPIPVAPAPAKSVAQVPEEPDTESESVTASTSSYRYAPLLRSLSSTSRGVAAQQQGRRNPTRQQPAPGRAGPPAESRGAATTRPLATPPQEDDVVLAEEPSDTESLGEGGAPDAVWAYTLEVSEEGSSGGVVGGAAAGWGGGGGGGGGPGMGWQGLAERHGHRLNHADPLCPPRKGFWYS